MLGSVLIAEHALLVMPCMREGVRLAVRKRGSRTVRGLRQQVEACR